MILYMYIMNFILYAPITPTHPPSFRIKLFFKYVFKVSGTLEDTYKTGKSI